MTRLTVCRCLRQSDIKGEALVFYDDDETSFPLLQCFYPDMDGKFPWEAGCAQLAIDQQPQLDKPKAQTPEGR